MIKLDVHEYCQDCTEGLSDPENGDFDSIGVHYAIRPDGEPVEIQRFFKEGGETGWIEIDQQEYDNYYRGKED